MQIIKFIIISLLLIGCHNNNLKSEYDIFFNDYAKSKSYYYVYQNNKLTKKHQYDGIIENIQPNHQHYYLQMNKDFIKYLVKSEANKTKKINLNNDFPTVFFIDKQYIYYSSNYLKENYLFRMNNKNKVSKYRLTNYFINNILVLNNKIYLFLENQNNSKQSLLVLNKDLKKGQTIKLNAKVNDNSNPFSYQNNIYYLSDNNTLFKINHSLKLSEVINLKEKYPHKIILDQEVLYYSNYDIFSQNQKNILTKINLKNKKVTKKYFNAEIVDLKLKKEHILVLNHNKLFILKTNMKQIKEIDFDVNKNAFKVE